MSIWQVNTAENYEYVEGHEFIVDAEGHLTAYDADEEIIAGWTNGFWLSYKNVEKVVDHAGDVPEVPIKGNPDRPDA